MNPGIQVGVNYFGRTVTEIKIFNEVSRAGIVYYADAARRENMMGLREFLSWLNVQKGGKPTDRWHAFMMVCEERFKNHKGRKRMVIDGKAYRMRRGKLVEIPEEWVGKTTHSQTIRKRPSKKNQGRRYRRRAIR